MANALPTRAVLTANDFRSGDIVFWSADGSWTTDINNALISQGTETAETLLSRVYSVFELFPLLSRMLCTVPKTQNT